MGERRFDLEERLLEFPVRIIRLCQKLTASSASKRVAGQLLRAGASPYANHGEAEDAESLKDFAHKLEICLKERRETFRWLKLIERVPLVDKPDLMDGVLDDFDQLIRIMWKSVETALEKELKL